MEEKNFLRLRPQSFSSSRTPRFSDLCVRRRSVVAMPPPAASPRSYDLEDRGHVLASAPWSCVRLRQPCFSFPFLASFLRPSRPSVCVEPRAVLSLRGRSFTGPVVSLALACYVRLPSLVSLCSSSPAVGEGECWLCLCVSEVCISYYLLAVQLREVVPFPRSL